MNAAIRILKKAERDLKTEVRVWKSNNHPEIVNICKRELAEVQEAIAKLKQLK